MSETFDKIQEALTDALGVDDDDVTPDATLVGDLGAESTIVSLMFSVDACRGSCA